MTKSQAFVFLKFHPRMAPFGENFKAGQQSTFVHFVIYMWILRGPKYCIQNDTMDHKKNKMEKVKVGQEM